jgi:hypothetical protein
MIKPFTVDLDCTVSRRNLDGAFALKLERRIQALVVRERFANWRDFHRFSRCVIRVGGKTKYYTSMVEFVGGTEGGT